MSGSIVNKFTVMNSYHQWCSMFDSRTRENSYYLCRYDSVMADEIVLDLGAIYNTNYKTHREFEVILLMFLAKKGLNHSTSTVTISIVITQ